MVKCPKCGNEQPDNIEQCSNCGFRISSYTEYLNTEAKNLSHGYNKNFYEISPQWQQYVDKEKRRSKGKSKRFSIDPRFVIGFLIVAIALGSFIKYAIDNDMFKKNSDDTVSTGQNTSNTSVKQTENSQKITESGKKPSNNNTSDRNKLSIEAQNAYESAKDYIDFMAFSKNGLIKQLTLEGYSKDAATEAVDSLNVNWNEQAARSAKEYLEFTSLSKAALLNQLKVEGFTDEQAEYGVKAVGYEDTPDIGNSGNIITVGQYYEIDGFRICYMSSAYDDNEARRTLNSVKDGYDVIRLNLFVENQSDYDQTFSDLHFRCYADDYTCTQLLLGTGTFSYKVKPGMWGKGSIFFSIPSGSKEIEIEYAPTLYGEAVMKLLFEGNKDSGLNYDDKIIYNSTPMKVGDSIKTSEVQLTYLEAEVLDTKNHYFLDENMKVIYIEVEVENISGENISISNEFFDCYADGEYCSRYSIENELFTLITPGRKAKGNIAFKVPKESKEIIIKYEYEPSNYVQILYQ